MLLSHTSNKAITTSWDPITKLYFLKIGLAPSDQAGKSRCVRCLWMRQDQRLYKQEEWLMLQAREYRHRTMSQCYTTIQAPSQTHDLRTH